MKRVLLQNHGGNKDNIPTAIALAVRECKTAGTDTITLITPMQNLDTIIVGEFLGKNATQTLKKGNRVPLGQEGIFLQYESVTTAVRKRITTVAVAFYTSAKDIVRLDELRLPALILVPWNEVEGTAWAAKWNAETHGTKTENADIDLPQEVIQALKNLSSCVNVSTGLSPPLDKQHAKDTFSKLAIAREKWIPDEIEKWAVRNGWKPKDAQELAALSQKFLE